MNYVTSVEVYIILRAQQISVPWLQILYPIIKMIKLQRLYGNDFIQTATYHIMETVKKSKRQSA